MSLLSYRLLKGALHERSRVLTIDAVSCDGHQVAAACHGVAKQRQVAVVDVGAVKGDDVVQLPLQSLSHRLNSQHLMVPKIHDQHLNISCSPIKVNSFFNHYREDLHDIIGGGPDRIYVLLTENPHQAHTVRLKDPLLQSLELAVLRDDDFFLVVGLGQVHVHLEKKVTVDLLLLLLHYEVLGGSVHSVTLLICSIP